MATETSSLGDEWQWISNDTAEVLRATVEIAFTADPRKNWSAGELARWIRDVALVSAKKNVRDHAAALGEYLVNGLGYVKSDEQEEEDCTDEDADTDDDGWLGGDGDAELSDGEDDADDAGTKKRKAPGGQGKNKRNWGPEGEERN